MEHAISKDDYDEMMGKVKAIFEEGAVDWLIFSFPSTETRDLSACSVSLRRAWTAWLFSLV